MRNLFRYFSLASAVVVGSLASAQAGYVATPPGIPFAQSNNFGNVSPAITPVCNNVHQDNSVGGSAGNSVMARVYLYCPHGFVYLVLGRAGYYYNSGTPGENDKLYPEPTNMGVEMDVPALWDSTKTYHSGDLVAWGTTASTCAGNPFWVAQATNTNSAPIPSNSTNWGCATNVTPIPVSFNGNRAGGLNTVVTPSGTTIADGLVLSDPVPSSGNCATGACFIAVRMWIPQSGTQQQGSAGWPQNYNLSPGYNSAASPPTDVSITNTNVANVGNLTNSVRPVIASGIPATRSPPTVALIGDSIADGNVGEGVVNVAISNGGSGCTSTDIGAVLTAGTASGTSGATGTPALIKITNQSAGAVTGLRIVDPGNYTNPSTQVSQTLPSTTQTLAGAPNCTGVIGTLTYSNTGNQFDPGDKFGAEGGYQRGLSEAGVAFVPITQSGDTCGEWLTADYRRLYAIKKSGARDAIIQLGINDVTNGTAAATIESCLTTVAYNLLGMGIQHVYLATILPSSVSTDGFITTGNQTTIAQNAARVTVNDWERTVPAPFSGVFDTASVVESSLDSGKFAVTVNAVSYGCDNTHATITCDGKHLGYGGMSLIANYISTNIGKLQ